MVKENLNIVYNPLILYEEGSFMQFPTKFFTEKISETIFKRPPAAVWRMACRGIRVGM